MIRRYDHEILGATVVRPLVGPARDGPADGVVLADPADDRRHRDRHRRQPVVRRARSRAHGARRGRRSDPQRRRRRRRPRPGRAARQLLVGRPAAPVDARRAGRCRRRAAATPPSPTARRSSVGKDSLNNEYLGADGAAPRRAADARDHRDRPRARRRRACVTPDLKRARQRAACSSARPRASSPAATSTWCTAPPTPPAWRPHPIPALRAATGACTRRCAPGLVRACHDVSEGGLAVALAEMCIAGRLGAADRRAARTPTSPTALFSESSAGSSSRSRPTTSTAFAGATRRAGAPCSAPSPTSRRSAIAGVGRSPLDDARRTRSGRGRRMSRPTALVIAGPGTNRDHDVAFALDLAGAEPRIVLAAELVADPTLLDEARLVVVAGGFSYADALGAGRMLALELERRARATSCARSSPPGSPVIGICNGFQVLTRTGLLPGALGHNASGRFECRWVELDPVPASVRLDARTSTTRSTARSPTAKAATCTPIPARSPRPGRWRCATPAPTPTARSPTSPASATPTGVVLGPDAAPREPRRRPPASPAPTRRRRRRSSGLRLFEQRRPPRQGAVMIDDRRCRTVHRHRPAARRSPRRQGPGVVRAARRPTRCSSPPTGCRRSTGSSPACRTRARCSTSSRAWWFEQTARHRRQPRRRRARPERARSPARRTPLPVEVDRARLHHRRHRHLAVAPVRRRRTHDLRLPLPRRAAEEHRAARRRSSRRRPRPRHGAPRRAAVVRRCRRARASSSRRCGRAVRGRGARAVRPRARTSAAEAGLILADTKYEFGVDRRRRAAADRRGAHARLVALLGRRQLRASGSPPATSPRASTRRSSAGRWPTPATPATAPVPQLTAEVWTATSARYIDAYERLTGTDVRARASTRSEPRIDAAVAGLEIT